MFTDSEVIYVTPEVWEFLLAQIAWEPFSASTQHRIKNNLEYFALMWRAFSVFEFSRSHAPREPTMKACTVTEL